MEISSRITHSSSTPFQNLSEISRKIDPETTNTCPPSLFVCKIGLGCAVQRHVAILVVCWGCCSSLITQCNIWLTLHWWVNQRYWRGWESSARDRYSRDSGSSAWGTGRKDGAETEEETTTDRLTKCEQIPILGSACTLHYLSQEPNVVRPSYSAAYMMTFTVPARHKPPSILGLDRFTPPYLVQILHLYTYISLHGY